jgi:tetratricopeptide (TPR) repeat protein
MNKGNIEHATSNFERPRGSGVDGVGFGVFSHSLLLDYGLSRFGNRRSGGVRSLRVGELSVESFWPRSGALQTGRFYAGIGAFWAGRECANWYGFLRGGCHYSAMGEKTVNDLPRELRGLHTKGMDALQRENFDYAIALFAQILDKEPTNYDCRKALRLAQLSKVKGGGGFFKKMFSGASASPQVAKAQLVLKKNPFEAIGIAEQILASDPHNSSAHKIIADAALATGMPKTAVLSLDLLVKQSPRDKELVIELSHALAEAGERSRAEQVLENLRAIYPQDNEIFVALKNVSANKTMDEGGYGALADGEGSYRDVLRNKDEAVSLEQEARHHKSEDVKEKLIREYEARLKLEPKNLKLLRDLGDLYVQLNQFDKGLEYFGKILLTDGGNDSSLQKKIAETKVKKFEHSLTLLDPSSPEYEEKASQIRAEKQAFRLAECKERSDKYPTDLGIRFELGVLYYEAGKIAEAIQEFQKAINNPNKRIQAMTYLANCFAKRGMNDIAARRLQEALKEKLVFDDEKKELVYTLGTILEKMGKREEAIEQYKVIYEMDIGYKDVAAKVDAYYAGQ